MCIRDRVALPIDHLSAYALTIEPNTNFDKRRLQGTFLPMSADDQAERMNTLWRFLTDNGFEHYEVSAFSRKGKRAVHNSLYWMNGAYLGVGAGAHSYLPSSGDTGAQRTENSRNPNTYIKNDVPIFEMEEALSDWDELVEFFMVRSRVRWGFQFEELPTLTGIESGRLRQQVHDCVHELSRAGLVNYDELQVYPTSRGFQFADTIAEKLVNTVSELVH